MKLMNIKLEGHPGVGDLDLSFCDEQRVPFNIVVLAGGNGTGKTAILEAIQKTFEGTMGQKFGIVTIEFLADEGDLDRMASTHDGPKAFGGPVTEFTLRHDSNIEHNWTAFTLSWVDPTGGPNGMQQLVIQAEEWRNVFRAFFSEASVNFNAKPTQYITGLNIDSPSIKIARSGNDLAKQITQLLVDVRAADAEDLARWVDVNPGVAPPDDVKNKRMARFANAFHVMFPTKRFKDVKHTEQGHSVEFEEFGRTTSIDNLSTGEKQIVFRAGFLLKSLSEIKSSIVLIDEPELSLHPEWQERIIAFYTSVLSDDNGAHPQILVSTHSPFIVHGAVGAKILILEKDLRTGAVREMPTPTYPAVRGAEAVRAFNIDGFLGAAKKPLLILTEGESDTVLFETAWKKLRPGKPMEFEFRAALGAKNLNITLNDSEVFSKLGQRMLLGVFDFDTAFNQWNGVWYKNNRLVATTEAIGLTKRHPNQKGWAMLLPVPSFREDFASIPLGGESILSAEFLFDDSDIPTSMLGSSAVALRHSLPYFKDAEKMNFATMVQGYAPERFVGFEPLLARWEDILAARI